MEADAASGLSAAQAQERLDGGWDNAPVESPGASVREIIAKNGFYLVLTFCSPAGGLRDRRAAVAEPDISWSCVLQHVHRHCTGSAGKEKGRWTEDHGRAEMPCRAGRADRYVGRGPACTGRYRRFSPGDQIPADAVVAAGECRVNEALVTGEADEIVKSRATNCSPAALSCPAAAAHG